jgi:hypothetical protein
VQQQGGIDFPILDNPSILFNLLLGKPVKLVEITLPELGFNFFYRQSFDHRPARRTFAGGSGRSSTCASATTRTACSSSSRRATRPSSSRASSSTRRTQGHPLPLAQLNATIAVGRNRPRPDQGGSRGRHHHHRLQDDLNGDGLVRFSEMAANVLANSNNPLAVFDITGDMQLFCAPT